MKILGPKALGLFACIAITPTRQLAPINATVDTRSCNLVTRTEVSTRGSNKSTRTITGTDTSTGISVSGTLFYIARTITGTVFCVTVPVWAIRCFITLRFRGGFWGRLWSGGCNMDDGGRTGFIKSQSATCDEVCQAS